MSVIPHEGSRSDRLSKLLLAIDKHHKGKATYDYSFLLNDLRKLLDEYAELDNYQGLDVDAIIESIKYEEMLSIEEVAHRVIGTMMMHDPKTVQSAEKLKPTLNENSFSVFLDMDNLMPQEVKIEFAPNNILIISARGTRKRMSYSEFLLQNKKTGELNKQGVLLLGIAHGKSIPKNQSKTVSVIRSKIFRNLLGIKSDPFQRDWTSHFALIDARERADERAKERASFTEYDPGNEEHGSYSPLFDDEDDQAGEFIRKAEK